MRPKQNKIFIISGPSGAGEDSVIEGLRKKIKFNRVVTTITRKPRKDEKEGRPYYFISVLEFKKLIKAKKFIEWAIVYGDYRGCTKKEINRLLRLNKPILWKVDWQGVKTIKKIYPQAISIFICPPSYQDIVSRLKKRGNDSPETIKKREQFTKDWLKHKNVYDYIIINRQGKLAQTIKETEKIINAALRA